MIVAAIALIVLYFIIDVKSYNKSTYKAKTQSSYTKVRFDKGFNGEFLTAVVKLVVACPKICIS